MTDDKRRKKPPRDKPRKGKSFGSRVEEFWQDVLDTLDTLVNPQPVPIPIPIRDPRRR